MQTPEQLTSDGLRVISKGDENGGGGSEEILHDHHIGIRGHRVWHPRHDPTVVELSPDCALIFGRI